MEKEERVDVNHLVGTVARLALYVCDELEPSSTDVLERDLDDVYSLLVEVERKARKEGRLKD